MLRVFSHKRVSRKSAPEVIMNYDPDPVEEEEEELAEKEDAVDLFMDSIFDDEED